MAHKVLTALFRRPGAVALEMERSRLPSQSDEHIGRYLWISNERPCTLDTERVRDRNWTGSRWWAHVAIHVGLIE